MDLFQIGIDQVTNIGKDISIDPKNLVCSICYCINISASECMNKSCQKLFCGNCVSYKTKEMKRICPFCRLEVDLTNPGEKLKNIIENIQLFCSSTLCLKKFNLKDYIYHLVEKRTNCIPPVTVTTCYKCKFSYNNIHLCKCGICFNYGCTAKINISCKYLSMCFNCKLLVCSDCIVTSTASTGLNISNGDFLCGLCTVLCTICSKQEATTICFMCKIYLCSSCRDFCDKCNIFICKEESCYGNKLANRDLNCVYCVEIYARRHENSANQCISNHLNYINCKKCYVKCACLIPLLPSLPNNLLSMSPTNLSYINCRICNTQSCIKNCIYKCKSCKSLVCNKCVNMCSICKIFKCNKCLEKCDECNTNFYFCESCDTDTMRKCNFSNCKTKICLTCWNMCNFCEAIYCRKHSISCINCEEKLCFQHFHNCTLCNLKNESYKKLCLKNCTVKCSFCENTTNSFCDVRIHKENIVKKLHCGHNVCKQCIKGCAKCGKTVLSCPKCIVNYFFNKCKYCNMYLCTSCANYCKKCQDVFCSFSHECELCGKSNSNNQCLNCVENIRTRCKKCDKKLENCNKCRSKYFCSNNCLNENKKTGRVIQKLNHICEMFFCNNCENDDNYNYNENFIKKMKVSTLNDEKVICKIEKNEKINEKINENIKVSCTNCCKIY